MFYNYVIIIAGYNDTEEFIAVYVLCWHVSTTWVGAF